MRQRISPPRLQSLLRSYASVTLHHLRPFIARAIVSGSIRRDPAALVRAAQLIAAAPDDPFSVLLSRRLSRAYFHLFPPSVTFLFNLLIRAFSGSHRHLDDSFSAFVSLLRLPALPDRFTFPPLAKAASILKTYLVGGQIHCQSLTRGFQSDVYVLNTHLDMYSSFGDMVSAQKLFNFSSEVVDVVSWNTLIDGYVKVGALDVARRIFDEMPVKNEVSWGAMISGYASKGDLGVARSLFDRMPVERDVVTWNSMVSGFARNGLLPLARKLFDEMPMRNIISWNSIVSGYAMNGEMKKAKELFDQMPERNVVSWSCMISGYAQSRQFVEALQLFKEMQKDKRVKPNEVTMVSVLSACSHLAALDEGRWVHSYIDKNHMILDNDYNLGAALIDMYAKCGRLDAAVSLFRSLSRKNVSSWNALITGLAINGAASESLEAFQQMQLSGPLPNNVTFVGVLMACAHGGLVQEGRHYFDSMSKDHGIEPELMHYGCMVDLFGRSGFLEEAEELVRNMPMEPDVMVLGALLGASRIHRDTEVADRIKRKVLELESRESGCHVLLSNIYAAAGRWAEAFDVRGRLRETGIRKEPGSSSVELDGIRSHVPIKLPIALVQ